VKTIAIPRRMDDAANRQLRLRCVSFLRTAAMSLERLGGVREKLGFCKGTPSSKRFDLWVCCPKRRFLYWNC
jgi:hypothetical protein